nr:rap guanine nucleotide exchange factor 6 [Hymenolepis microstoma]
MLDESTVQELDFPVSLDLSRIQDFLGGVEGLAHLRPRNAREVALAEASRCARALRVRGDSLLFRRGDPASAWFILLSGCVLVDHSLFLPRNCFGTRLNGSHTRHQDCFVLEDSDLIVIPYFERDQVPPQANSALQNRSHVQPSAKSNGDGTRPSVPSLNGGQQTAVLTKKSTQPLPERQSSLSESDSAIARTVTTASNSNSSTSLQGGNNGGCESTGIDSDSDVDGAEGGSSDVDDDDDNLDEEGDEDEDFDSGSSSHESLRDSFWDALLKEPKLRTPADIEVLVENVQKLPAFSNLSEGTRAALCCLMLVAVVRDAGQIVLSDNEILDTWSVILNGTVEVIDPDGTIRELSSGDSFGVRLPPPGSPPSAATLVQRHRGQMRTVTEDCQFVCVAQTDYFRVMARAADAEVPETEEGDSGRVVLVYEDIRKEAGQGSDGGTTSPLPSPFPSTQVSRVVIKGTPDKLIEHLKSPEPSDQSYAEDLLLTYRTFLPTPALLVRRLLSWWDEALPGTPTDQRLIRARIQRYVVLWVHNHPGDFHDRPAMLRFLETFSDLLQRDSGNRRLLHLALSTRARSRTVPVNLTLVVTPTSTSTTCHIVLPCVLVGGQGEFGVFVNQAEEIDYGPTGGFEIRAVVRDAGQIVLSDNEILDTWSVILNGTVEVIDPDGTIRELSSGDSFGVRLPPPGSPPSAATLVQRHRGQMRTVTEDCQFVCVAQTDYFRVMARAADAEVPETEEGDSGRVVLVYEDIRKEAGQGSDGGTTSPLPSPFPSTQVSRVVIKGTPDKLIEHLKSPEPSDQSYAEDLLLTYRTFLPTPALLVRRLLSWWDEALPGTPTDQRLIRARIQRYVVLWVHNHPGDFHDRPAMLRFLETFSDLLQRDSGNRRLLHLALSTRARSRTVPVNLTLVVTPTIGGQGEFGVFVNQAEEIDYGPTGGFEIRAGLRRGDQLLALQSTGVEGASLAQLASMIASLVLIANRQPPGSTVTKTLAFTIVYNPSQFYELMSKVGELNSRLTSKNRATVISTRGKQVTAFEVASIQEALSLINSSSRGAVGALPTNNVNKWMDQQQQQQGYIQQVQPIPGKQHQLIRGGASLRYPPGTPQLRPSVATNKPSLISAEAPSPSSNPSSSELTRSSSQPDLAGVIGGSKLDQPRGSFPTSGWGESSGSGGNSGISVIRVWRSLGAEPKDQVSKLVALHPRTFARTAVCLAAQEFNIDHPEDAASEFCLCLVTVDEGPIMKQSRIADSMDDLANRIALNSRYYLKPNRVSDVLITDEVAKVIYQESKVSLTQLSPEEVAIQLTLDDFSVFRSIESAEFVDKVFGLTSSTQDNPDVGSNTTATNTSTENIGVESYTETRKGFPTGCANLDAFADLVNKEAYWVPSEICAETNLQKRVDMLKRFIKIAKLCKDLRNFNTMFCILVGLHMSPVERLRQTWERLPNKYVKMSRDLALVLDPSRNFAHYRNLLNSSPQSSPMMSPSQSGTHCLPLVPYLPLVLKDLTFIHLGNPSRTPASNTSSPQLINFAKLRMFAKEIRSLRRMCDIDYDLPLAQRLLQSSGNSNKFAFLLPSASSGGGGGGGSNNLSSNAIDISSPQIQTNAIAASSNSNISINSGSSITSDSQGSHGQTKKPSDGGVASLLSGATSLLLSTATGVGSSPTRNTVLTGSGIGVGVGVKKAKVKSIYAAWQMRLRVRTYMANLRVNEDLERLSQLSQRAENGGGGNVSVSSAKESTPTPAPVSTASPPPPTSPPPLPEKSCKSQLPPTPPQLSISSSVMSNTTNTSTISSHRSIFGNQSIEDARKLIALQERTSRRRMRMCAVPTYSQHQQYHQSHPQNQCYHQASSSYYQHYFSSGTPGYDPRMAQRMGRYLPPTTANAYQLLQLHQQQHQQYRQQQTSAMAAAQWVARQQQLANQQRSKFQSPPHLPTQNQQSMPQQKQSPLYDYASVLKQQQMRNAVSANFSRRLSEPPPRGNVGLPQGITSPSLVHRRPSPQGLQPGGPMQRPPLPSYHEVVAMKQQQAHLVQNAQLQPARNKDGRPTL